MFENLSERLDGVVKRLRGLHKLTDENISEAMRDVRMALLEADVNIAVVKQFTADVRKEAVGMKTMEGLNPGQSLIKVVHDKLVALLGGSAVDVSYAQRGPTVVLMTGLQGSGKTTTTAKLAKRIAKQGYKPMMVSADVYRPAAIEQLKVLGTETNIPVFPSSADMKPEEICRQAMAAMDEYGCNVLLADTAGRLHIDDELMEELQRIKKIVNPTEILFVADSMTGQDAVNASKAFNERIGMTGVVLTKLDGDARGGAALSIKSVTGAPIKFAGVGEKIDQLEQFHPDRLAGRILGMGDVMTLIERAQESVDKKQAEKQALKMFSSEFNLNDFLEQIKMVKKMGPLDQLLKLIPGVGDAMKGMNYDPSEMVRTEAIINSMTKKERANPGIINASRKRRIADGSGADIMDVNKLLKNFTKSKKLMKHIGKFKGKKEMPNPFSGFGI